MPLTLILARHGNTFDPGDILLRCGARTDPPLSSSGRAQAEKLGTHLAAHHFLPRAVYASPLRRAQETAHIALASAGVREQLHITEALNEIDYGPDEGQPEDDVIARVGIEALEDWEINMVMPDGWSPRPDDIAHNARILMADIAGRYTSDDLIWAFTSNGIARFFGSAASWSCPRPDKLKLATAAYAHIEYDGANWHVKGWNIKAG